MIRYVLAPIAPIALIAWPAVAQTIAVDHAFTDKDGDGRIEFGAANAKLYGVPFVNANGRDGARYVYCGPKGCDAVVQALVVDPWAIAAPTTDKAATIVSPKNPSSSAWFYPKSGQVMAGYRLERALDAIPYTDGLDGLTVTDLDAARVRTLMAPLAKATARNVRFDRIRATCTDRCFYIRGNSANWTIRDFVLSGPGPSVSAPFSAAVQVQDEAGDILIERGEAGGFFSTSPAGYPNSDVFVAERGNARLTFRYVSAHDATNGCFDLKSSETLLDHVKAARCGYGYRLWGSGRGTTVGCQDNHACLQIASALTDYVIDRLEVSGTGASIVVDSHAWDKTTGRKGRLTIGSCSAPVKVANPQWAVISLGQGCVK
jgi:hypothetical protein